MEKDGVARVPSSSCPSNFRSLCCWKTDLRVAVIAFSRQANHAISEAFIVRMRVSAE